MATQLEAILILIVFASKSESLEIETCSTDGCKLGAIEMVSWMNQSVDPCENFYDFACGGFKQVHQMINDPNTGKFYPSATSLLGQKVRSEFIEILSSMSLTNQTIPRIFRFLAHSFQTCLGAQNLPFEESVKSLKVLYEYWFQKVVSNASWENMWIYSQARSGFLLKILLEVNVSFDSSNSSKTINITFPNDERRLNEGFVLKQKSSMLSLAKLICSMQSSKPAVCQDANIEKVVEEVINLEVAIIRINNSTGEATKLRSSKVLLKNVNSLFGFDFKHTLRKLFHIVDVLEQTDDPDLEFSFPNVEYIKELNKLLTNTPADILQAFFGWKLFAFYGGMLSKDVQNVTKIFSDSDRITWKNHCLTKVNAFMPKDTYLYIFSSRNLPDDYRAVAEQMVDDLNDVFRKNLETNDWLDEETRKEALFKLSKVIVHVGASEAMKKYAEKGDEHYGMTEQIYQELITAPNYVISLFEFVLMVKRVNFLSLDQPDELEDSDSWRGTHFDFRAYYDYDTNQISILIPSLRPSYFSPGRLFVQNYGHLGTVIGHELTHGFDPKGSQKDAYGKKRDWWTATARERFRRRSQCFIDDANSFSEPITGGHPNGTFCVGETVADAGGVHLSYTAFQERQNKEGIMWKLGEGLWEYTPEQLFFIAYAQSRCEIVDERLIKINLKYDPHPPKRYRSDGTLHNYDKWYDAFGCEMKKNNGMVMCKLW